MVVLVISLHPELTERSLIKTKDTPITQEIARVSGTLYQELGAETNLYIFPSFHTGQQSCY